MTNYILYSTSLKRKQGGKCSHGTDGQPKGLWYCHINMDKGGFEMVIVAGYGHGDTSTNPGPDWLHFT